ncbi:hypothetical protein D1007_39161 [Hordeum vulgare]|nr:hypothetical protein D1007_39161 [Hordeum vulgare]
MPPICVCLLDERVRRRFTHCVEHARRSNFRRCTMSSTPPSYSEPIQTALLMALMRRVHACRKTGACHATGPVMQQRSTRSQRRVRHIHAPIHFQASDLHRTN